MTLSPPPDRRRTARRSRDRRDIEQRPAGNWTDAERDAFIHQLREERKDAQAITIKGGNELMPGYEDAE